MKQQEADEPPPKMPSEHDMKDPAKMQEYMLQMGEYSARQQLKLQSLQPEVEANQIAHRVRERVRVRVRVRLRVRV